MTLQNYEVSLILEYDEQFSFRDRTRVLADMVRDRLIQAGLKESIEVEAFDHEVEWRINGKRPVSIRCDALRAEVIGSGHGCEGLVLGAAALVGATLDVARLISVEAGFQGIPQPVRTPTGRLTWVEQAFVPIMAWAQAVGDDTPGARRLGLTWDWSTSTTSHSLYIGNHDDREIFVSYKVRESYLNLEDLRDGGWYMLQQKRFATLLTQLGAQMGFVG
jgi:hypothetical protein